MTVRDAVPSDAVACAEIYSPYVRGSAISFEEEPPDTEEMTRRIASAQERHAWLVAERDGAIVGYAYAGTWRTRAAYSRTCEVSVYVDATGHGQGLGRLLYATLLDRMREAGMRLAVAGATMPNDASDRLHRALGFEVVGTFREVGFKQGQWCDVTWFQKSLVD